MWIRCSMLRRSWARGSGQIGQVRASGQLHKQGTVTLKQGAGEADQTEHGHKNTGSGAPGSCRAAFMIVSDRRRIIFICGRAHGKAHHTPVAKRVKGHTLRYNLTLSHSASPRHTLHNSITRQAFPSMTVQRFPDNEPVMAPTRKQGYASVYASAHLRRIVHRSSAGLLRASAKDYQSTAIVACSKMFPQLGYGQRSSGSRCGCTSKVRVRISTLAEHSTQTGRMQHGSGSHVLHEQSHIKHRLMRIVGCSMDSVGPLSSTRSIAYSRESTSSRSRLSVSSRSTASRRGPRMPTGLALIAERRRSSPVV